MRCILFGLYFLAVTPFLAYAYESVRPFSASHFEIETDQKYYRVPGAQVAWVDFQRMREDFPSLKKFTDADIEKWILDQFAYVSETQLRLRKVRSTDFEINLNDTRTFLHPIRYRRASVARATINGQDMGFIDLKGSGHVGETKYAGQSLKVEEQIRLFQEAGGDEKARDKILTRDHSDGLMSLGEGIAEVSRQQGLQALFDVYRKPQFYFETVESYFLIDLGFNILKPGGQKVPAGIIGRQAHLRGENRPDQSGFYRDDLGKFQKTKTGTAVDMGGVEITHHRLRRQFEFHDGDPQKSRPWSEGHSIAKRFRELREQNIFHARHEVYQHFANMLGDLQTEWQQIRFGPEKKRSEMNVLIRLLNHYDDDFVTIAKRLLQDQVDTNPRLFLEILNSAIKNERVFNSAILKALNWINFDVKPLLPELLIVLERVPLESSERTQQENLMKLMMKKNWFSDDAATVEKLMAISKQPRSLFIEVPELADQQLKKMQTYINLSATSSMGGTCKEVVKVLK